jgi:hypothetical protein
MIRLTIRGVGLTAALAASVYGWWGEDCFGIE